MAINEEVSSSIQIYSAWMVMPSQTTDAVHNSFCCEGYRDRRPYKVQHKGKMRTGKKTCNRVLLSTGQGIQHLHPLLELISSTCRNLLYKICIMKDTASFSPMFPSTCTLNSIYLF